MKYLLLLLSFNLLSYSFAQEKDLVVTYSLQSSLEDKESYLEAMSNAVSKIEKRQAVDRALNEIHLFKLSIDGDHDMSSFQYQEKLDNYQSKSRIRITMIPAAEWCVNLKEFYQFRAVTIEEKEDYYIKDSLQVFDWKVTREKKKVFNVETRKATAIKDSVEYTAWYAPSIPLSHGPNAITGLPGLIMELDVYYPNIKWKPHHHYIVSSLETKEKIEISIPKEGK